MSVTTIDDDEARRLAVEKVRSELGLFVRLGEGSYDREENEYQFPLVIQSPKLIRDGAGEIRDTRFFSELELGTVTVDGENKNVSRPKKPTIDAKIRQQEENVERAVRKALVSVAGSRLSHLPFPENQFAPLEDILSHVIVNGHLPIETVRVMDQGRKNERYTEYTRKCIELDLLERKEGSLTSGDLLIGMESENQTYQGVINDAIGHYFEKNIGEFEMINRTLKPYLVIAGRYYRRALELEEMPEIDEAELRNAIKKEYSGKERDRKLMKMYRYLVHLEDIGILRPQTRGNKTLWIGNSNIDTALRDQSPFLNHYQSLLAGV